MSLDVDLIKSSFAKAAPMAAEISDKFYEFLWGDYPASKGLFEGVKMNTQKKALMKSLGFIVENVDKPDVLVPYLKKMGGRHVSYDTAEEHYELVGATLLKTFAYFFGDSWTQELNDNWTAAYQFIAQTMIEGARELKASSVVEKELVNTDVIRDAAKQVCGRLLVEVLEECVDDSFKELVREKVETLLLEALAEQSESLFKKSA